MVISRKTRKSPTRRSRRTKRSRQPRASTAKRRSVARKRSKRYKGVDCRVHLKPEINGYSADVHCEPSSEEWCLCTDLEPDDIQAIHLLCMRYPKQMNNATYIVGEGSKNKVELCRTILQKYLPHQRHTFNITQSFFGPIEKQFPESCFTALGVTHISETEPSIEDATKSMRDFLQGPGSKRLVLLKPWHELISCIEDLTILFTQETLKVFAYGSFNSDQVSAFATQYNLTNELTQLNALFRTQKSHVFQIQRRDLVGRTSIVDSTQIRPEERYHMFGDNAIQTFTKAFGEHIYIQKKGSTESKWIRTCALLERSKFLQYPFADNLVALKMIQPKTVEKLKGNCAFENERILQTLWYQLKADSTYTHIFTSDAYCIGKMGLSPYVSGEFNFSTFTCCHYTRDDVNGNKSESTSDWILASNSSTNGKLRIFGTDHLQNDSLINMTYPIKNGVFPPDLEFKSGMISDHVAVTREVNDLKIVSFNVSWHLLKTQYELSKIGQLSKQKVEQLLETVKQESSSEQLTVKAYVDTILKYITTGTNITYRDLPGYLKPFETFLRECERKGIHVILLQEWVVEGGGNQKEVKKNTDREVNEWAKQLITQHKFSVTTETRSGSEGSAIVVNNTVTVTDLSRPDDEDFWSWCGIKARAWSVAIINGMLFFNVHAPDPSKGNGNKGKNIINTKHKSFVDKFFNHPVCNHPDPKKTDKFYNRFAFDPVVAHTAFLHHLLDEETRDEFLLELRKHVKKNQENEPENIVIGGDFNDNPKKVFIKHEKVPYAHCWPLS